MAKILRAVLLVFLSLVVQACTGSDEDSRTVSSALFEANPRNTPTPTPSPTLVPPVDPGNGLAWSSYLGSSGDDEVLGVTSDSSGNIYVVGKTTSPNFPTTSGAWQTTLRGSEDAFVVKFTSSGSRVWSTLLGGAGLDRAKGVAVDATGVYVCGQTSSSDFPVTPSAFQRSHGGDLWDAFAAKISPDGSALLYATYLGGNAADYAVALEVDSAGQAFVAGLTGSGNYPITPGVVVPGFSPSLFDASDGFVTKLNAAGSAPVYSTYIGTSGGVDVVNGLTLDGSGQAVVVGWTVSQSYPTTAGAYDRTFTGASNQHEVFITKLNTTGTAYVFSTFLGGTLGDDATTVALDSQGKILVAGRTLSRDFPVTAGAFDVSFDESLGNYWEGFVGRLSADGSALEYATYFGGNNHDEPSDLLALADGSVAVVGGTSSAGFPVTSNPFDAVYTAPGENFLMILNPAGSGLTYSTFAGTGYSSGAGSASRLAPLPAGRIALTGWTDGVGFSTTTGAFDNVYDGAVDGFISVFEPAGIPPADSLYFPGQGPVSPLPFGDPLPDT
ncbi:MAG: SBBP repeat-containing protein [Pseudomonadota bacterium]